MCVSYVVRHSYQKCKLFEAGDGSVTAVGAMLYNLLPTQLRGTPSEESTLDANQIGPQFINETRIQQCSFALDDPTQEHKPPTKRRCVELTHSDDEDPAAVTEHPEKPCSAFQVGEEAIKTALMTEMIVSDIRRIGGLRCDVVDAGQIPYHHPDRGSNAQRGEEVSFKPLTRQY